MYQQIKNYLAKDIYPFHMPGHKRNPLFLPSNLQELDMTEIPGMDVLSSPAGVIDELQKEIANFYGANYSFFLVNGSSAGIIAAVCATCADGETLIVPRNAHASVYNAMVLSGAVPKYIMPELTADGLAGGINPSVFDDMPEGATALVVSPTYEGFISNISEIAKRVRKKSGVLIVDEAHGAHFPFLKEFPYSALSQGADIVVQSLHKTLPAPSQCAVLHVSRNSEKLVDINRIKFLINAVQTSSPSYILMSVCDFMLRKLWQQPKFFQDYFARLEKLRAVLPGTDSSAALRLSGAEQIGRDAIFDIDPGKLLLSSHTSISAEAVAEIMATEYKVQMEMATERHILAMTSVADTEDGFDRLVAAVDGINSRYSWLGAEICTPAPFTVPEVVLPPRQAVSLPSKELLWEEAAGRVSAQLIAKCPPGIALVAPGERIPVDIPQQQATIRVINTAM